MNTLEQILAAIVPADREAMADAQRKWNAVGKPLGSLGLLEDMVIRWRCCIQIRCY